MRRSMSDEHKEALKRNHVRLVEEMQCEYMLSHFIQEGVLLPDMVEEIKGKRTSRAMNELLLQFLPMRGNRAFDVLLHALRDGSQQPHLADLLLVPDTTTKPPLTIGPPTLQSPPASTRFPSRPSQISIELSTEPDDVSVEASPLSPSSFSGAGGFATSQMKVTIQDSLLEVEAAVRNRPAPHQPRKTSNHFVNHTEILPGVTHLIPYVVPHVHNKWRQFAAHLGLSEAEVSHIREVPHEKSSRYATLVLHAWIEKFKMKASKARLLDALRRANIRKAVDAIAIYDVPKPAKKKAFIRNGGRSAVTRNMHDKHDLITRSSNTLAEPESEDKWDQSSKPFRRKLGALDVSCEVTNVELKSHRVFLDMAPKITEAMLRDGEGAKDVLNGLKELKGILCNGLRKGSIIVELQVYTLLALSRLRGLYDSGALSTIMENVLVTDSLLREFEALAIHLNVHVEEKDFERCRKELEDLQSGFAQTAKDLSPDGSSNMSTSDDDQSDEIETEPNDDGWHQLVEQASTQLAQITNTLRMDLKEFEGYTSEFLLSLQILHPLGMVRVESISALRELYTRSQLIQKGQAERQAIDRFLAMIRRFTTSIRSFQGRVAILAQQHCSTSDCSCAERETAQRVYRSYENIIAMLADTYDFSLMQRFGIALLTTQEAVGYRGLVSYPYVVLDRLREVQQALQRLASI